MSSNHVAVLDIGTTKVAAMSAELDPSGALKVLGHAIEPCEGVRKGVIVDLGLVAASAGKALQNVEQQTGQGVSSLVMAISGRQAEPLIGQGLVPIYPSTRNITRDDVLQVINHSRQVTLGADRELVQAIPSEFRVDGKPSKSSPLGAAGGKLEVRTFLVSGDLSQIEMMERLAEGGSRSIDQFVYEPLASGLGVLTPHQLEAGSAVVDIGGDTTAIGVFRGGTILHAAIIPVGGKHVTSDVSKLLKTSIDEAETHKIASGAAMASMVSEAETINVLQMGQVERRPMQRRVFCEIVEARMREIVKLVREALERGGCLGELGGGIAVTGGGSLMKGVPELLESALVGVKVKAATPHLRGPQSGAASRAEMATCAGLARFALESCSDELSPASKDGRWSDKIRTLLSLIGR